MLKSREEGYSLNYVAAVLLVPFQLAIMPVNQEKLKKLQQQGDKSRIGGKVKQLGHCMYLFVDNWVACVTVNWLNFGRGHCTMLLKDDVTSQIPASARHYCYIKARPTWFLLVELGGSKFLHFQKNNCEFIS